MQPCVLWFTKFQKWSDNILNFLYIQIIFILFLLLHWKELNYYALISLTLLIISAECYTYQGGIYSMGPPRKSPRTQMKGKTNHRKPFNKILFVDRFNLLLVALQGETSQIPSRLLEPLGGFLLVRNITRSLCHFVWWNSDVRAEGEVPVLLYLLCVSNYCNIHAVAITCSQVSFLW